MLDIDYTQFKAANTDDGETTPSVVAQHPDEKRKPTRIKLLDKWTCISNVVPGWTFPDSKSLFVLDCGGAGSCMFHVIAAGLNLYLKKPIFSMHNIRRMVADNVTQKNLKSVVSDWSSKEGEAFRKLYAQNPSSKTLLQQIKNVIANPDYQSWGDTIFLQELLLTSPLFHQLELGFAILSWWRHSLKKQNKKRFVVRTQLHVNANTKRVLIMYVDQHRKPEHWQLAGIKNHTGQMASVFAVAKYPKTLYPFLSDREIITETQQPRESKK